MTGGYQDDNNVDHRENDDGDADQYDNQADR